MTGRLASQQPTEDEWDAMEADWWTEDAADLTASLRNDGAWLVTRRCLDCRRAFYADEEYDPTTDSEPCDECGGTRFNVTTLPMERRAKRFALEGIMPAPAFGCVELDWKEPTDG